MGKMRRFRPFAVSGRTWFTPSSLKPTLVTLFQPDTEADYPREQGPEPAVEIDVEPRTDHGMIRPERRSREVYK
jgi:hypothetical protein